MLSIRLSSLLVLLVTLYSRRVAAQTKTITVSFSHVSPTAVNLPQVDAALQETVTTIIAETLGVGSPVEIAVTGVNSSSTDGLEVETDLTLQVPETFMEHAIQDVFYTDLLVQALQRITDDASNNLVLSYAYPKVFSAPLVVRLEGVSDDRDMTEREQTIFLDTMQSKLIPRVAQHFPTYLWQSTKVVAEFVVRVKVSTVSEEAAVSDNELETLLRNRVLLHLRAYCRTDAEDRSARAWEDAVLETGTNYTIPDYFGEGVSWRNDLRQAEADNFAVSNYFANLRNVTVQRAFSTNYEALPNITLAMDTVQFDQDMPAYVWTLLAICLSLLVGAGGYTAHAVRAGKTVPLAPAPLRASEAPSERASTMDQQLNEHIDSSNGNVVKESPSDTS